MSYQVHNEDCLIGMANLAENSIDAIVTDPPYGLSFMGKGWDHGIPGEDYWRAAMRVAKPGAYLLAFGGTRTYHRLTCAIEDAGWEIRDCIMWVYGSGFPKSLDVSKAIDKAAGAKRERSQRAAFGGTFSDDNGATYGTVLSPDAITDTAKQWQGWGTALKPAFEPIILARKPLVGTVAANVAEYGTGAMNIDGCRVNAANSDDYGRSATNAHGTINAHDGFEGKSFKIAERNGEYASSLGRWPANLIHDGSDEVLELFPQTTSGGGPKPNTPRSKVNTYGEPTVSQSESYGVNSGSAARFFYCAKASKADRDEGLEGEAVHRPNGNKWTDQDYRVSNGERSSSRESGPRKNHHPTVKPTALMRYLCRLVTPPNGLVCDPFTGSGSTGKAALLEGFRFVGFELEAEYAAIARARCAAVAKQTPLLEAV